MASGLSDLLFQIQVETITQTQVQIPPWDTIYMMVLHSGPTLMNLDTIFWRT